MADTAGVTDEPALATLCATVEARFPEIRVERCELVPGGWDNAMLLVNGEWVFRIPHRPVNQDALAKEARLLPELAPVLPVAVPRFEHTWRGEDPPRILAAYRWIEGVPLSREALEGPNGATLTTHIAAFLTALHAFPVERALALGVPGRDPQTWHREYDDFYRWIRQEAFPLLAPPARRWASHVCETYLGDVENFTFQPVLLHRDLAVEHILCDPARGRITGVIDWGDASVGDPAFDFTGLFMECGERATRAVLEAYGGPKDPGMMERAHFYANIAPFYGIIYGRKLSHPEWTQQGMTRLRSLVR